MTKEQTDWETELGRVVQRIGRLQGLYDRAYDASASPTSVRASDDEASWPLAVGQHAMYSIVQALDMCQGLADLFTDGEHQRVPLSASYPLVRAAIESASMALWLLTPESRRERIVRRLQAAHDELSFEKSFFHCVADGKTPSDQMAMKRAYARDANKTKNRMRSIARANGIDALEYENLMPGWEKVVELAAPVLGDDRSLLVVAWRFASGLVHPSFTRGRIAHEFMFKNPGAGTSQGEVTASLPWTVSTASIAAAVTERALLEYRTSKILMNGDGPVPSPRRSA